MNEMPLENSYDDIERWCNNVVQNGHDILFSVDAFDVEIRAASRKFNFPVESLNSFLRNVHLKRVKKQTYVIKNKLNKRILPEYITGKSILELAKTNNFPPSLLARTIIDSTTTLAKKQISEAMRDPIGKLNDVGIILEEYVQSEQHYKRNDNPSSSIQNNESMTYVVKEIVDPFSGEIQYTQNDAVTRLAQEVQEAIFMDPLYGPRADRERQIIGMEYEIALEQILRSKNIAFETERELKKRGTSKTPDILFSYPVAVKVPKQKPKRKASSIMCDDDNNFEWKMICWIDSKALFGDIHTHQTHVLPQAEGYIHRFGPGLVLYWFGHGPIERLDNGHGDVIITSWNAPNEFMLPTGEIASTGYWSDSQR